MNEKRTCNYHCETCKNKLQKRGKTATGKQRWLCHCCAQSKLSLRPDLSRGYELERFVSWLLGKLAQNELEQPPRTFRNQTSWCWNVAPPNTLTGEIHHAVVVDGIRVGSNVCLIARTTDYVITWVWMPYESSQYWTELLRLLPQPKYVVCDGQRGMLKAIAICWPETTVQRCRFHAWLNVKSKLTLRPKSAPAQELLQLTRNLLHIRTRRQARSWKRKLKHWHRKHHSYIDERTMRQDPQPGQRRWHYTHARLRSAYKQLHEITDDLLRSSYRPHPELPSTTNHIEGGINSQIRLKLKAHRGMPVVHQMRLVDWYLYSRTEEPKPPRYCL